MNLHPKRVGFGASVCLLAAAFVLAPRLATAQTAAAASGATAPKADDSAAAPAATASPPADAPTDGATAGSSGGETSTGSGLFESSQSAAPDASGATEAPAATGFDLNGYVRGDMFIGKVQNASAAEMKAAYSELSLKLTVKKEKFGDAYAEPRIRYGLQADGREVAVDLREAYVNLYAGPLDLRLGQQIIVWGRADALNPTSNITPVDFRIQSPVEDDRRLGNVGARAFLNFSPFRLEGVWMPLYSPTELPPLPLPAQVELGPTHYPPAHIQNGLEAARLHLELPAIEMSASYLYGYAPLPGLALDSITPGLGTQGAGRVTVSRTAYNQHVLGFDFATTLGDFLGLRGELAYRDPLHFRDRVYAPNPDIQYVLGVDHTFGEVSVILQYLGRYAFNWQQRVAPPTDPTTIDEITTPDMAASATAAINETLRAKNQILFSQLHQVQNMASLRLEWLALHQTLTLSALTFMNFSTKEWLLFPKVSYQLTDNLSATVGAQIYEGPYNSSTGEETLFGVIKSELSAGYAELRMAF
jgi:hypothetical protein